MRFVGVDIASETHVVAVVDDNGAITVKPTPFAEDAAGYFTVLAQTAAAYGLPVALYSDQHGIFVKDPARPPSLAEQLAGHREQYPDVEIHQSAKQLKVHAEMMKKHPGMEHDEPYMAHVPPGKTGEIVWTFNRAGTFEFACLMAGHFEAGMIGRITVQ